MTTKTTAPDFCLGDDPTPRILGFDNRDAGWGGKLHLRLTLGGMRIRYAYIRKNGCSSFKTALGYSSTARVSDLARSSRAPLFRRYDATIFVWRDPVARLVSLYRNKILDRRGAEDILRRYRARMNEEPTSFERFVEFAGLQADPHCLPQAKHLYPIRYTHAIPLERLHETMSGLVGKDAARPFARRVNASDAQPVTVSLRARQMIRSIYAADYQLIDQLA